MTESLSGSESGPSRDPESGPAPGSGSVDTEQAAAHGNGDSPPASEAAMMMQVEAGVVAETVPGPGHVDRPLTISGGLAVLSGVLAVLLVANAPGQVVAVGIGLGGMAGLALGNEARHRGYRVVGIVLATLGVVGVAAGVGWAVIGTASVDQRIEVLPGIAGLAVLVAGVSAAWRGHERLLVSVGTGAILFTVFISGMVQDAPVWAMLAATAATVVAWDTGEQAINLGAQIGRQARTWRAELVHESAGGLVGLVGVGLALGFVTVGVSGLSLLGLTTLLAAAVILAAGLYL